MVLKFEISSAVKRRCAICNEIKLIPINLAKPICKECMLKKRNRIIYYGKFVIAILLVLLLIAIISL